MSIASTSVELTAASPWPPYAVRRFTVEEYHGMSAAGILGEDERVELLDGWIIPKMPRNPPHDATIGLAGDLLRPLLPGRWRLNIQAAVTLSTSEPEPDISVVRSPIDRYFDRHPAPDDIGLLVEIAESSLARDRDLKAALYARERIPIYWIINLIDRQVEVLARPESSNGGHHYAERRIYRPGETLPLVLEGEVIAQIAAADLLPPVFPQTHAAEDDAPSATA